jgi:hypothetical protein
VESGRSRKLGLAVVFNGSVGAMSNPLGPSKAVLRCGEADVVAHQFQDDANTLAFEGCARSMVLPEALESAKERRELLTGDSRSFDDRSQRAPVELAMHGDGQWSATRTLEAHVASTLARLHVAEASKRRHAFSAGNEGRSNHSST